MSAPIHKTCYRCGRAVADLVEPADVVGGLHGACSDCRLTLGAREVARRWHLLHPELPCVKDTEIPRGMNLPEGGVSPTEHTKHTEGKQNQ